jgi:hypothetical protein
MRLQRHRLRLLDWWDGVWCGFGYIPGPVIPCLYCGFFTVWWWRETVPPDDRRFHVTWGNPS